MSQYKIIFSALAKDDLNAIIDYYLPIHPDYAYDLFPKIQTQINLLKQNALLGRVVPELSAQRIMNYRELIVGHYRIIYSVVAPHVIIHTIIDARRNVADVLVETLLR